MTSRAVRQGQHPPGAAAVRNDDIPDARTASALSSVRGIPWWAAILLATTFTGIGVLVDLQRLDRLGLIFQVCYFTGCLLAVVWVQRRGLFGPMVQPPLILAIAVPGVVYASGGASGAGMTAKALALGTPLINGFPTMAATTAATALVGIGRLVMQRPPKPPVVRADRAARDDREQRGQPAPRPVGQPPVRPARRDPGQPPPAPRRRPS